MTETKRYVCRAPSNIAFIKYWGKELPRAQWPTNSSLSMTLKNCYSETSVALKEESDEISFNDQKLAADSEEFRKIQAKLDIIREFHDSSAYFSVITKNSFPKSCGIASSASGMAALAIAASCALTRANSWLELEKASLSKRNLSSLARLLSGSAGRSFWPGFVYWEKSDRPEMQYCYPLEVNWQLCDTILLVDQSEKKVSSSSGHLIAETSPLFRLRLENMQDKLNKCSHALEHQDIRLLGPILEEEALNMHSVMMSSEPPLKYLNKSTIELIVWIRKLRREENLPVYFTIDAGPNLHLIYEPENQEQLLAHLEKAWPQLKYINDQTGDEPTIGLTESHLTPSRDGEFVGSRYTRN